MVGRCSNRRHPARGRSFEIPLRRGGAGSRAGRTLPGMPRAPLGLRGIDTEAAIARICTRGLPPLELFGRVARQLRRVVPYDAGCWKPTDPETLLFTGFAIEDPQPGRLTSVRWRFVDNELLEPDSAKFSRLARAREPVTTLHRATHGEPERSRRYREIHRTLGFGAELRTVFRSGDACWGSVALVRNEGEPDFDRRETAFVARLCTHIALGLRLALLREAATADADSTPGLIVLRDDLTLDSLTPAAAGWLEQVPADLGTGLELPAAVYAVARRARAAALGLSSERPPIARVRLAGGRWLLLHAASLESSSSAAQRTAIVLAPAGPVEITPLRLELHGLSEREREVTRLLVRGLSTDEVAKTMQITRHTVKDHTKAVYTKLGVTSRHELTAKLFAEHLFPTLDSSHVREVSPSPN